MSQIGTVKEELKKLKETIKEIKRNKPKKTRQERQYEKFSKQLDKSIEKDGVIEQPVICQYGVISGLDRIRHMKGLPMFVDDLLKKETAEKFGIKWIDVKDKDEYHRKRVTCAYLHKADSIREDLLLWAESLAGTMPTNEVCSYIVKQLDGILSERTIERYLPEEYKMVNRTPKTYVDSMSTSFITKPDTVTTSIRLPRPLFEKYKEKYDGNINFRLKWLIEKDLELDLVDKEDIKVFIESNKPQQQPEIKQTIQHAQEILENKQEDKNVDYKPSKFDFCKVCNRTTRHVWNSFTQEYMCGECYAKEMSKVTNQSPARIVIGRRE
jgi:hypothetical protein